MKIKRHNSQLGYIELTALQADFEIPQSIRHSTSVNGYAFMILANDDIMDSLGLENEECYDHILVKVVGVKPTESGDENE